MSVIVFLLNILLDSMESGVSCKDLKTTNYRRATYTANHLHSHINVTLISTNSVVPKIRKGQHGD